MTLQHQIANIVHEHSGAEMYGKLSELMQEVATQFAAWHNNISDTEQYAILEKRGNTPVWEYLYNYFIENVYGNDN